MDMYAEVVLNCPAQKCLRVPGFTTAPAFSSVLSASFLRTPQTGVNCEIPYKLDRKLEHFSHFAWWGVLSTSTVARPGTL
jgi:hypothetical protein